MARPLLLGMHEKLRDFFIGYILIDADQNRPRTQAEAHATALEIANCFRWIAGELEHATPEPARADNGHGENRQGQNVSDAGDSASVRADGGTQT